MGDEDLGTSLNQRLGPPAVPIFSDRDTNSPLEKFLEAPPQAELEKILGFPLDEDRLKVFLAGQKEARENQGVDASQGTLQEKLGECFLDVHQVLSRKSSQASLQNSHAALPDAYVEDSQLEVPEAEGLSEGLQGAPRSSRSSVVSTPARI